MAMNVFFFSDETMHKLYLSYGKYDFIQQIPQIVYSTIISQLMEVFLCFLSLTDKQIYKIKKLMISNNSANKVIIFGLFKCIIIKLGFFFYFYFFIFYWILVYYFFFLCYL